MATAFFSRISSLIKRVSEIDLSDYFSSSENGSVISFPLGNVITHENLQELNPILEKDVNAAYAKHTMLREFCAQHVDIMENNKDKVIKIIRSAIEPVDTLVALIFITATERREKDLDFLLSLDTFAGAPMNLKGVIKEKLFKPNYESGLGLIHHLVLGTLDNTHILQSVLNLVLESPEKLEVAAGEDGMTPMLLAGFAGSKWAIIPLVGAGANFHAVDKNGNNIFHLASSSMRDGVSGAAVIEVVLGQDSELKHMLEASNTEKHTPVTLAAANGDHEALKVLLTEGASAKAKEYSPLCYAVLADSKECVEVLVKHGANVNDRNEEGLSALAIAAAKGSLEIMRVLLQEKHNSDILMTTFKESLINKNLKCSYMLVLKSRQGALDCEVLLKEVILVDTKDFDSIDSALYTDLVNLIVQHGGLGESGLSILKIAGTRENSVAFDILLNSKVWGKGELEGVKSILRNSTTVTKLEGKITADTTACVCCFEEDVKMVKFSPCEHVEVCVSCFEDLKKTNDEPKCVMCRETLDLEKCKTVE